MKMLEYTPLPSIPPTFYLVVYMKIQSLPVVVELKTSSRRPEPFSKPSFAT